MKKKALIKDIAEAAGVSSALVSYVLNNKAKEARVSPTTAIKIKEIAKKLDYQPNQVAKSLKSGKSLSIGLVVADISNPFFGKLARAIEDESQKKGYTVLFGSSDEDAVKSYQLIEALVGRQIDGFIIVPAEGSEEQLKYLEGLSIPFVLLDRYFESITSSYVVIDNFKATYLATEHLIKKGHENIGYVRYKNNLKHTVDRYQGYLQALKDYGKPDNENLVCRIEYKGDNYFHKEFETLIASSVKVDAVLFSTNTLSLLGLKCLKEKHIRIPEEVDVFCFDENEAYNLSDFPINYVRQPLEEMAHEAVELLMKQINHEAKEQDKIILNPEMMIRE